MAAQRPGHGVCVVMLPSRHVQLQKLDYVDISNFSNVAK